MSEEAEISRKCISCHNKYMCQKSRGSCISGVSVLQKVTLDTWSVLFGDIRYKNFYFLNFDSHFGANGKDFRRQWETKKTSGC